MPQSAIQFAAYADERARWLSVLAPGAAPAKRKKPASRSLFALVFGF